MISSGGFREGPVLLPVYIVMTVWLKNEDAGLWNKAGTRGVLMFSSGDCRLGPVLLIYIVMPIWIKNEEAGLWDKAGTRDVMFSTGDCRQGPVLLIYIVMPVWIKN